MQITCDHKNCKNKSCNWWIPFSGFDHCLKKYIIKKNINNLTPKDLALIYKKPISIIQESLKEAKKEALLDFFYLNYLSTIHEIEFLDTSLDLDLCHVCNSSTNNTNHICKTCKIFTPIVYLEKRYKLTAIDIYTAGNKHSNIFYPITKTTPNLWKNYFKKLENYN